MPPTVQISQVPTNIITGFLGSGKSTAILHLLKSKPANERWAILVNEFGEIGIDGAWLEGHREAQGQVFIKEVPGGCMCCTAGLPMQVALNALLKQARPDRLLIEPTGLGHPAEVLKTLSGDNYREVLAIEKVVTLVDARQLSDLRYTTHETFKQQIAIADIIVGNKRDLYQAVDFDNLRAYAEKEGIVATQLTTTQQGALNLADLNGRAQAVSQADNNHAANSHQQE